MFCYLNGFVDQIQHQLLCSTNRYLSTDYVHRTESHIRSKSLARLSKIRSVTRNVFYNSVTRIMFLILLLEQESDRTVATDRNEQNTLLLEPSVTRTEAFLSLGQVDSAKR